MSPGSDAQSRCQGGGEVKHPPLSHGRIQLLPTSEARQPLHQLRLLGGIGENGRVTVFSAPRASRGPRADLRSHLDSLLFSILGRCLRPHHADAVDGKRRGREIMLDHCAFRLVVPVSPIATLPVSAARRTHACQTACVVIHRSLSAAWSLAKFNNDGGCGEQGCRRYCGW